jgi:predicted dehydrogenase
MIRRRSLIAAPGLLAAQTKFRVAVVGTEHGHVRGFLNAAQKRSDIEIRGPFDFAERGNVKSSGAQAIACFTSTDRHLEVARLAGELQLPMMMEKPLAVSNEVASEIARIAKTAKIPIFVNYETTWYRSHAELYRFHVKSKTGGAIRKMVAMDGHQGPKEIGVGADFLEWLRDPVRNGAGALFDFGCYGANLMTWMLDNQAPRRVHCSVLTNKPAIYGKVDDEATILVEYDNAQGIIQGSWNWPFSRKDFEVYAERAYAHAYGGNSVRLRAPEAKVEETMTPPELPAHQADAISHLMAVARREIAPNALSSLENNLVATRILVAARESARQKRAVSV